MRTRDVFIRNWVVKAFVGIHPHEYTRKQKLRLNITLTQEDAGSLTNARIAQMVDYEWHYKTIKALLEKEHVQLIETLADKIAAACLEDTKVLGVHIEIEKMGLFKNMESCGVRMSRAREL